MTCRRAVAVMLIMTASFVASAQAAEIKGKVMKADGDTVQVAVEGKLVPEVGARVKIYDLMPGLDEPLSVGTGEVVGVEDGLVSVKMVEKTGRVRKGHWATILAARPTERAQGSAGQSGAGKVQELAMVPPDALGFVHVRVGELLKSTLARNARKELNALPLQEWEQNLTRAIGLKPNEIERLTVVVLDSKSVKSVAVILRTAGPYPEERILASALGAGAEKEALETRVGRALLRPKRGDGPATCLLHDQVVLIGPLVTVQAILDKHLTSKREAVRSGELSAALALAGSGKHLVVAGFAPTADVARAIAAELPKAPKDLTALKPLLRAKTATLAADLAGEGRDTLQLAFAGKAEAAEATEQAREALGRLIQELRKNETPADTDEADAFKEVLAMLRGITLDNKGATIEVTASAAGPIRLLVQSLARAQQAANRIKSMNNLGQLALAMQSYHERYRHVPTAITGKDGKPLLSWRVALLPYIDGGPALHEQFRLDEAWDSPHNKALLEKAKIPPLYAPVGVTPKEPYLTYYQAFVGEHAAFDPVKGLQFDRILNGDGLSNTLLLAEAAEPVPWTKPEDLPYDPDGPLPKLGGVFKDGFCAVFCDGHPRFIPRGIEEKVLRALITRDGREQLPAEIDLKRPAAARPPLEPPPPPPPAPPPPAVPAAPWPAAAAGRTPPCPATPRRRCRTDYQPLEQVPRPRQALALPPPVLAQLLPGQGEQLGLTRAGTAMATRSAAGVA